MIQQLSRQSWLDLWEVTGREPHAHPAFMEAMHRSGETFVALGWQDEAGAALVPLALREVPVECEVAGWRDAISPYGYGGPFTRGRIDWTSLLSELAVWLGDNHVLSAFIRSSLGVLPADFPDVPGATARTMGQNIVVDLRRDNAEQWSHYDHKVRKNVNKAKRGALRVEIDSDFSRLDQFLEVYEATMDRRNASDFYYFDRSFFETLAAQVPGGLLVAYVLNPEDVVVSTELVLVSDEAYYSFLGGTLREAFPLAPNDLLKHAVIENGHVEGRRRFVLGGGYTAGDGIFRYKRSFDKDGVVDFRGLCLVGDPAKYALAAAAWADRHGVAPADAGNTSFFPLYRAPAPFPSAEA